MTHTQRRDRFTAEPDALKDEQNMLFYLYIIKHYVHPVTRILLIDTIRCFHGQ